MRLWTIAILGVALIAGPAMAQQNGQQGGGRSYGSANCRPPVPCDSTDVSALVANANACISDHFGYPTPASGFFDENQGLDGDNCLAELPDVLPRGIGGQLTPSCCIIQAGDNLCNFHCNLYSTR